MCISFCFRAGPTAAVMNATRMQNHLVQQSAQINNPSAPGITSGINPYSTVNQSGVPSQLGPIGSAVAQNMSNTAVPPQTAGLISLASESFQVGHFIVCFCSY